MKKDFKTIGIIGGLGPQATIDLYQEIVNRTKVTTDQDHIPVIIYSDPQTPSRLEYILNSGPSPLPNLIKAAQTLKNSGAEYIAIACNTAHLFVDEIVKATGANIIHMINETFDYINNEYPNVKKVGLMATDGALKANIYNTNYDFEIVTPDSYFQSECLMPAIFSNEGIKAGNLGDLPKSLLTKTVENLRSKGAEIIILGCTEIPLVIKQKDFEFPFVNPTTILAEKLIQLSKNEY